MGIKNLVYEIIWPPGWSLLRGHWVSLVESCKSFRHCCGGERLNGKLQGFFCCLLSWYQVSFVCCLRTTCNFPWALICFPLYFVGDVDRMAVNTVRCSSTKDPWLCNRYLCNLQQTVTGLTRQEHRSFTSTEINSLGNLSWVLKNSSHLSFSFLNLQLASCAITTVFEPVMERTLTVTDALLEAVINHVALPPRLPAKADNDADQVEQALNGLLLNASKTLTDLAPGDLSRKWDITRNTLRICSEVNSGGKLDKASLLSEFQCLKCNDTLILHIKEQNAGLLIRRHQESVYMDFKPLCWTSRLIRPMNLV